MRRCPLALLTLAAIGAAPASLARTEIRPDAPDAPDAPAPSEPQQPRAPVAQPALPSGLVPPPTPPEEGAVASLHFNADAAVSHAFDADLRTTGSAAVTRVGAGFDAQIPVAKMTRLTLEVSGESSFYDFSGATTLIPGTGDPWNTLHSIAFDPRVLFIVDEDWSWFVGGDIRYAGESGADTGDALTYGGSLGARYRFSDTFALTFGAFATSRLEDDPLILPIVGIEWKITDRVRFATRGLGAAVSASLTDTLDLSIVGAWNSRDFRLDKSRALLPSGVVRDTRVPVGVELAWTPAPFVRLALTGGFVAWQKYEVFDSGGNDVSDTRTDPGAFVGFAATFHF